MVNSKLVTCNTNDCSLEVYKGNSNCILHCEKSNYSTDFHKIGFLNLFYEKLIAYIVEKTFSYENETPKINKSTLEEYLKENSDDKEIELFSKKLTIVFTHIIFPSRDSRDRFDYLKVLKKIGSIWFNYCQFNVGGLDLGDIKCFYQDCIFNDNWSIYNTPILENVDNVLFQQCIFHKRVSSSSEGEGKYKIDSQLFNNCEFKEGVEFTDIEFNAPICNNTDKMKLNIKLFHLIDCIIKEKFILNHCGMELFSLEDSVFEAKFEFKQNIIEEFNAYNTNFSNIVDFYETQFIKFNIKKSIFEDFVGFEKCIFGKSNVSAEDFVAKFTYATFLNFINFRSTKFNSGLDIENINLKESPNFLNTEINPNHSNRETFRIIKNSFDKMGNYIEANKYFAYEMRKYREELRGTNKTQEKIILWFNEKISNYGQSYIRPIIFLVMASIVYYLLILGYENNLLYEICPRINGALKFISNGLNGVSENILPFSRILKDGMEFVSLIFYIIFASLIWQVLVAIKRHTRR